MSLKFLVISTMLWIACESPAEKESKKLKTENPKPVKVSEEEKNDSTLSDTLVKETVNEHEIQERFEKELLNGIWAESENENAFYKIEGDSVYYIEELSKGYYLELKNGFLIYHLDGISPKFKLIKLSRDSLVMKNFNDEVIRLYNRKPN